MLDKVRTLLRLEVALVAAIAVAAAAGGYLYLERSAAQEDVLTLESQHSAARDDLEALKNEQVNKTQELEEKQQELVLKQEESDALEKTLVLQTLSSSQEALELSAKLINYAAERDLDIDNFATTQGVTSIGEVDFPTASYDLVAEGTSGSLIGMLDIIGGVVTARVDRLELTRDPKDVDLWIMSLDVMVLYAKEG